MRFASVSVALVLSTVTMIVAAGCGNGTGTTGGQGGLPACPSGGTKLTYDSFGKSFFDKYCQSCHAAASKDRQGAPAKITFDTAAEIRALADDVYERAGDSGGGMPPSTFANKPTDAERKQLVEWLSCDAP